jgi:VWFA-related protein
MQMLENYRKDRRVLVVFSDGFNLGSQTGKNEIIKRAMNSNVTVYGLGFNTTKALWSRPQKDPPPDLVNESVARAPIPNMAGTPTQMDNFYNTTIPLPEILLATGETVKATVFKNSLEYFASYSGGRFYKKWGKSTVQEALNQIATEIHGQYELAYVPNNQDEEGFHRIKVEVRRPGARVRARTGWFNYVPPK